MTWPATWREKAQDVSALALRCGHAVPEEAPEAFAEAVPGFLRR